jgi:hypothetical protein
MPAWVTMTVVAAFGLLVVALIILAVAKTFFKKPDKDEDWEESLPDNYREEDDEWRESLSDYEKEEDSDDGPGDEEEPDK